MVSLLKPLILASGSLRRQKMLRDLGWTFEIRQSAVSEIMDADKTPGENVIQLSEKKARAVADGLEKDAIVIGADTIVVLNGEILNKPSNPEEARMMLSRLSRRTHQVFTGFTLLDVISKKILSDYAVTGVTFRELDTDEIDAYVRSGAPLDKAGAYGIQGDISATFAERIDGCFYNVVGLPLAKIYTALDGFQKQIGLRNDQEKTVGKSYGTENSDSHRQGRPRRP